MELTAETKYQLLLQISHKIRDTLDLDEILNHLLDMIQPVLVYDAAGIFVLNQDLAYDRQRHPQQVIASVVWRGFDAGPPEADPMRSLGKGIIGHVIQTGRSVVVADVRQDNRYVAGRQDTLSEVTVPIIRNERPIGALNLESDQPAAYGENDVELLQFFADAAAISIEKAMLHRQILEKERLEEQLKLAQQVQSRLLPDEAPRIKGYDIAGICISTHEVGGDYFDYIPLDDQQLGLTIADVSGEGVSAALIMAAFRALLRSQARYEADPAHISQMLNRLLPESTGWEDFVTAIYGVFQPASGRFVYVNSGHNPPLLFRANGAIERLRISGPGLSILREVVYETDQASLDPGDLLLFYTDGVVELTREETQEFGVPRLVATVQRCRSLPAAEILGRIVQDARRFSGTDSFRDDFTLLIIKRQQTPDDAGHDLRHGARGA